MNKLIEAYEEYIKLLVVELEEVLPLAVSHGWRSSRYETGKMCRRKIAALKYNASHPTTGRKRKRRAA